VDICRAQPGLFQGVAISSVDAYQGREADVVVFSTVRCNAGGRLGFVTDKRRLNVAITRPRRCVRPRLTSKLILKVEGRQHCNQQAKC